MHWKQRGMVLPQCNNVFVVDKQMVQRLFATAERDTLMNNTIELQQLLSSLVDAWPAEHNHPTIEQARAYLETQRIVSGEQYPYSVDRGEDYNTAWYSL
jgi:hypothetical protein